MLLSSRCSKSEVSFVNEMLSLIKKKSFESRICISILPFAYDQPLSFINSLHFPWSGSWSQCVTTK